MRDEVDTTVCQHRTGQQRGHQDSRHVARPDSAADAATPTTLWGGVARLTPMAG